MNQDVKRCDRCGQFYVNPCQGDESSLVGDTSRSVQVRTQHVDPLARTIIMPHQLGQSVQVKVDPGFLSVLKSEEQAEQ